MIRHIVLMKVKDSVTDEKIGNVLKIIGDLKFKIPGIMSYDAGINCSTENFNQGYTHVFLMDFVDVSARDVYLTHPEHEGIQPALKSILTDVDDNILVLDFEL